MELTDCFACWYKFTSIDSWLRIFGVNTVKNGCGQSGDGTLKLTLSEEWTDGRNYFCMLVQICKVLIFANRYQNAKISLFHLFILLIKIFLGWHGQKWVWPLWSRDSKIDSISIMNRGNINWFFACCYKFRKAKS